MSHRRPYIIPPLVLAVTLLAVVIGGVFAARYLRDWLCGRGVEMLAGKLGTAVRLDSASVNLAKRRVVLYGVGVDDRRGVEMLAVDTLSARVELLPLLRSEVVVSEVRLHGVRAVMYKVRRDTAANYQFALDAFKTAKRQDDDAAGQGEPHGMTVRLLSAALSRGCLRWDVLSEPMRGGDTLDANHLCLDNVGLRSCGIRKEADSLTVLLEGLAAREKKTGMAMELGAASYDATRRGGWTAVLEQAKFGYRDWQSGFARLTATQEDWQPSLAKAMEISVDTMTYRRDNGRPHKRTGRPHRGYFDPGHINAVLNMKATVTCATTDSVKAEVQRLSAYDRASGLFVKDATALLMKRRDTLTLSDADIALQHTAIHINKVDGVLLRGTDGRFTDVLLSDCPVTARVTLHDIARPFAPVLSDFITPLHLSVTIGGTLNRMAFSNINISTRDKRLRLTAQGNMLDVLKGRELRLRFSDISLNARKGIKETIVGHFAKKVRMKMVRQMRKLGDISYRGQMAVYFRREDFSGTLFTKYGKADFAFTIDGNTKLMTGNIATDSLELGTVMNVKGLGYVNASATYSFSVASKRMRPVKHNGRLPIGWLKAQVESVRFKRMNFSGITAMVHSDGATAEGEVFMPKKLFDISVMFWYTQTDSVQDLKFKPRLLKHKKAPSIFEGMKKWKDYMKEAREKAQKKETAK